MSEYKIVFNGQLMPNFSEEVVTDSIQRSFKLSDSMALKLLSNPPRILKKTPSHIDAKKYQSHFSKIGLVTEIISPSILETTDLSYDGQEDSNVKPLHENQIFKNPKPQPAAKQETPLETVDNIEPEPNKIISIAFFISTLLLKPSNLVLIFAFILIINYSPIIDGIIRNGFTIGMIFLASSLPLKFIGR